MVTFDDRRILNGHPHTIRRCCQVRNGFGLGRYLDLTLDLEFSKHYCSEFPITYFQGLTCSCCTFSTLIVPCMAHQILPWTFKSLVTGLVTVPTEIVIGFPVLHPAEWDEIKDSLVNIPY